MLATLASWVMATSRRLRSCMVFWLSSELFQKAGLLMASSVLARSSFLAGASKIAPHSDALLAKRSVGSFEFFNGHDDSILAGLEMFALYRRKLWVFPFGSIFTFVKKSLSVISCGH